MVGNKAKVTSPGKSKGNRSGNGSETATPGIPSRLTRHYMTTEEAVEFLGVSYETLWRMRQPNDGRLSKTDVVRFRNRIFFKRSAIARLANQLVPSR
jgi:hypothetical protein